MFIDNLRIDQFGQLRDTYANGLHRLTVLGCSNESSRESARDFMRWMLFGNQVAGFGGAPSAFDSTYYDPTNLHRSARPIGAIDPRVGTDPRYFATFSARGVMSVTRGGRRRQIQRAGDSAYGRLSIDGRYDDSGNEIRSLVGHVTPSEFDRIFAPEFTRDIHPDELLASVRLAEIDLAGQRIPNGRRSHLQQRHRQLRAELERVPFGEAMHQLVERRTYLLRRIEELNHQEHLRRRELEKQYSDVSARISSTAGEVSRLRGELQLRDDEANQRRVELEEAWRVAQQAKETYLRQCRQELSELESRTERWRSMLGEVRSRMAEVHSLRVRSPNTMSSYGEPCLVTRLSEKLDRLRRDMGSWSEPAPQAGTANVSDRRYVQPALDDLRREVSQLCQTLQRRGADGGLNKERWLEHEADYLQHCESLMSNWLGKLERQLGGMRSEVSKAECDGLTLVDGSYLPRSDTHSFFGPVHAVDTSSVSSSNERPPLASTSMRSEYDRYWSNAYDTRPLYTDHFTQSFDTDGYYNASPIPASPSLHVSYGDSPYVSTTYDSRYVTYPISYNSRIRHESPMHRGHVEAVVHSCDGYDVIHPDADPRLRDMMEERNRVFDELEIRQRELESLESQRDTLDEKRHQVLDYEIQSSRKELTELDVRFHSAEARERLEREIAHVVEEMSRERDEYRPSLVLDHASRILAQLTGGRYTRLRIGDGRRVAIDDAHGLVTNLVGGSRDLRSDAYLALCLAFVAEYRRKGHDLPMIISEPFLRSKIEHDRARAAVLRDFAGTGHQIIVLTSRPSHCHELFRGHDHIYVDLQPRPVVRPAIPPLPRVTEPPAAPDPPIVAEPPITTEPAPTPPPTRPEYEDQVRFKRRPTTSPDDPPRDARSVPLHERRFSRTDGPSGSPSRKTTQANDPDARHRSKSLPAGSEGSIGNRDEVTSERDKPASDASKTRERASLSFSDEEHSLSLTSPIDATEVIDPEVSVWLREMGIETVREFLGLASTDLIEAMLSAGFESYPVRRWQDELALRCWVVGLAATDAAMLVNCGIDDAERLAEMDADELYDFLVRRLKTQTGSTYDSRRLQSLRDRVHFWVRAARRSRTDWIRYRTRSYGKRNWTPRSNSGSRSSRSSNGNSGSRSSSRARSSSSSRESRGSRSSRSSRSKSTRSSRSSSTEATVVAARSQTTAESGLRFYLDSSDPLVDAPSIGARTAEHFHAIGVVTVGDFINLDPEPAASKIDNRRISAKTIREWQAQAVLACRVPQIRGHDAQILVACDVKDPTMLARMEPDDLWARVKPFTKTSEGKRIIRGGKAPDLAEVRDWILWAKSSRTMRAA